MTPTLKYDSRYNGAKAVAKAGAQVVTNVFEQGFYFNVAANTYYILTGYYYEYSSFDASCFFQTTGGGYIVVDVYNSDWNFTQGTAVANKSQKQAQDVVNKIIKNNQTIICNNLLCARFVDKLTATQKKQLYELQERLEARNNALMNDQLLSVQETAVPSGYVDLQAYLDRFMQSGGVGSLTVTLIVTAIVIASLSTAAYFAYKYYADESEQDVKFSNELTKVLTEKLTDAEYQQLLEETQGKINKAKIVSRLKGNLSIAKAALWGIALLAVGYIYKTVKD